ncbi:MAG: DNA-binding protein [Candidatus Micrarchaeota archaeon]|nr:DNA-binding protein [Candidatus Micrarchaeota archaeon]
MGEEEDDLEALKRRRAQKQQGDERKKVEEQLKTTLRVVLEDDAYQRLMNVKLANSQLFLGASQHIVALFKRFGRKLNDKEALMILKKLKEGEEKETKITFNRK